MPGRSLGRFQGAAALKEPCGEGLRPRFSPAALVVLGVLSMALASCGHDCLALPCALPIAINISVTRGTSGTSVEGVTVNVTGATVTSMPCSTLCHVPGTAGTYTIDVTAPGFAPERRTLLVQGTTPPCGCPTVVTESVAIALVPASSSVGGQANERASRTGSPEGGRRAGEA